MVKYWLHVNHPTSKARLHVQNGCVWVRRAAARLQKGEAYGPKRANANGYWEPFDTLPEAQAAQQATRKEIQDRCHLSPCRMGFESDSGGARSD